MADMNPRLSDTSKFPDPVYKETVLRPLFDGAKNHHVDGFRRIDRAHLVMLRETGILDADTAAKIAGALDDIDRTINPSELVYTGEVEDFFFLIEKELKARIGVDIAGRLHTARSRNDIDHTLFKIGLKEKIDTLTAKARLLLAALIDAAERNEKTLIVAYTHGQPAQPTTFGHYLSAAIEVLIRDIDRFTEARRIVDLSPMGAAAITTSGFPIDRARVAELLGFAAPLRNSYSCIAAVDYTTATYGAIELMFLHLGRLIQDFQFWTSFEVGQIYVPNSLVQISSIMPQKRNPVPIEHLRHLASQTFGRARTMLDVMHNTPFTDMNDSEGETQGMGYEAFASAGRVLDLLASLVGKISIDPERVDQNIRRSCITITELADSLVRIEDLSFRQAHEIAATVAKSVVALKGDLPNDGYQPFRKAFQELTGRETGVDEEKFRQIVSPEHFVAVRSRFGGPAPEPMREAIAAYRDKLGVLEAEAQRSADHEAAKAAELAEKFTALTGSAIMATIELNKLVKRYGKVEAVKGIDLAIEDGEFVVFVGPSGCGKSTTLRMIAGLEEISGGTLRIAGNVVNEKEPKQRNIAMVFQNYAIYPHMTVRQNIGFGLYTSKLDKAEKNRRIEEAGRVLGLEALLDRRPAALSGGQRQRVAIGRAMVRDPSAFLFDEPLSNLDAQLRSQMRIEIKRLHQRLKTTTVYVTHDQVEAMTMADRIVVMKDGHILQVGTPSELYETPVDVFTARFIGSPSMNLLRGTRTDNSVAQSATGDLLIGIRPHDLLVGEGETNQGAFFLEGTVTAVEPLGPETLVHLDTATTSVIATARGKSIPTVGSRLQCQAQAGALYLFDAKTEKLLGRA